MTAPPADEGPWPEMDPETRRAIERAHAEFREQARAAERWHEQMRREMEPHVRAAARLQEQLRRDMAPYAAALETIRREAAAVTALQEQVLGGGLVREIAALQREFLRSDLAANVAHIAAQALEGRNSVLPEYMSSVVTEVERVLVASRVEVRPSPLAVREPAAVYRAMTGARALATTEVAVDAGMAQLGISDERLSFLVSSHIGLAARGLTPVIAASTRSDATAIAWAAVEIWTQLLAGWQGASAQSQQALLALIVGVLVVLFQHALNARSRIEQTRMLGRQMGILEEIRDAQPGAGHLAPTEEVLTAQKDRPLREYPDAQAQRIGTLPAGTTVRVLGRYDRWRYVQAVGAAADTVEGWVFLRDLRPVVR